MGLSLKRAAMKSYSRGSYAAAFSIPAGGTLSIHRALTQAWPVLPGLVAPAMQGNVPETEQRLREREVRQLVEPDKQKFGALILVDVAVVAAEAKARGGAVVPGDQPLRFIEAAVQTARNVAAKISEERGLQLRIGAAQQQRVAAGRFVRLKNRFPQQRLGLAGASGASEQSILRRRAMKLFLARKRVVVIGQAESDTVGYARPVRRRARIAVKEGH